MVTIPEIKQKEWNCLTCVKQCTYASISLSIEKDFGIFSCLGPEVPFYYGFYLLDDNEVVMPGIADHPDYPEISDYIETNQELIEKLENKYMPR